MDVTHSYLSTQVRTRTVEHGNIVDGDGWKRLKSTAVGCIQLGQQNRCFVNKNVGNARFFLASTILLNDIFFHFIFLRIFLSLFSYFVAFFLDLRFAIYFEYS